MRVLFIIPGEEQGNSMIFAKRQLKSLQASKIEADGFYLSSRTNPFVMWSEFRRFRKKLSEFKPDLIHVHYGTITAFFAAYSNLKPLVITYHGSDLNYLKDESLLKEIFRKILSQLAALRSSQIICVSEALKSKLWWKKSSVSIMPMGVNTDVFKPMDRADAQRKSGIQESEKVIIFNHNNAAVKRLDIAEMAIKEVKEALPESRLYVLNGGVQQDEMVALLNASDCLLMCSDSEGSPTLIKEAMACNLPIVATDVGDIKQTIDQTSPYFITEQNPTALSNCLKKILASPTRSNGRNRVFELKIDEQSLTLKLINLYQNLIRR